MSLVLLGIGPARRPCWKIADFGISTAGTSKTLVATKERRGTASYSAPEILLAEGSIPSYSNKVDIWGFGTILYELWMGKRPFQTSYHVMQYFWSQLECPKLEFRSLPIPSNPAFVLRLSSNLWTTMKILFPSNPEVIPSPSYPTNTNIEIALNCLISLLLHRDGAKRPSIREVGHLVAANHLASSIHEEKALLDLGLLPKLTATEGSSEPWLFVIELDVVVPHIHIHKALGHAGVFPLSLPATEQAGL